jgi:phage gp29-like protein
MATFLPIGKNLPPRRDALVEARSMPAMAAPIASPRAEDRTLDFFEREQLPTEVRSTMAGAWGGDIMLQLQLFNAMLDTWPRLQKAINEIARRVTVSAWKVVPYAQRGESPTPEAEKLARFVESALWGMTPDMAAGESGLESTIRNLVFAYYMGHGVSEIRWTRGGAGWIPRATKTLPARYFGYPDREQGDDRLQFDPSGQGSRMRLEDFEENRFLVAVNSGHQGHPLIGAPLRALTGYWLASSYGLKWFMSFTQLYGIPWRHAEVAEIKDQRVVESALAAIGANGYIVTGEGVKINVLDAAKGGDALPQKALIDLADQQCDQFILGQTLTGGTDGSGSRALGEVHKDTLDMVVAGVCDFVGEIITHQFIPALVAVNYGTRTDAPGFWAAPEETKDELASANRMKILTEIGVPMSQAYVYDDLGIPVPAATEVLFQASPPPPDPSGGGKPPGKPEKAVTAADAARMLVESGGFRTLDDELESRMEGFPEIGAEMKGQLPRPEDMDPGDPLRGDVQRIWDRFRKETRARDGKGNRVIAPGGAAQYFSAKGNGENLDTLRERMNEQGFFFGTPGEMLDAVYESLEGRKTWGTMSTGDFEIAAADATTAEVKRLEALMAKAQEKAMAGGLVDEDKLAALLAAAWISGAKKPTKEKPEDSDE